MNRVDVVDARSGAVVFAGLVIAARRPGAVAVVTPRGTWIYFAHDGRGLGGAADLRTRESVS